MSADPSSGSFTLGGAVNYGETTIKTVLDSDTNTYIGDGVVIEAPSVSMRAEGEHVG